jgi:hypothetical protein
MNTTCPETAPVVGTFSPDVMEPLNGELAITGRGAALPECSQQGTC